MPETEIIETSQPTEPKSIDWPKIILATLLGLALLTTACVGYWYSNQQVLPSEKSELNILERIFEDMVLLKIPRDRLYYYYAGEQVFLRRGVDQRGVYFTPVDKPTSDSPTKLWVGHKFVIKFKEIVPEERISSILMEEHLVRKERPVKSESLLVSTSRESVFRDALQMSNYIYEAYADLVEYIDPNFTSEFAPWPNLGPY